jgi:hypothetical protein
VAATAAAASNAGIVAQPSPGTVKPVFSCGHMEDATGQLHQLALIAGLAAIYKLPNSLFRSGPLQRGPEMTTDKHQTLHRNISVHFFILEIVFILEIGKPTRASRMQITRPDITAAQCHRMRGDDCSAPRASTPTHSAHAGGSWWGPQRQQPKAKKRHCGRVS